MGKPKSIYISQGKVWADQPDTGCGIEIMYTKSKDSLNICGWFDSFVGIEPMDVLLEQFVRDLGIPKKALLKIVEEM